MSKLTLAVVSDLAKGQDVREIAKLDASKQGITGVDDLGTCIVLTRLDLSHNSISDLDGILHCQTLTWLDLSHNQLESLTSVQSLTNLVVLNASHNTLVTSGDLSPLRNLKALVLSNNQLSELTGLSALRELNTLVLSHNCFKSLTLKKLSKLTKLSLSHNSLRAIPDTQHNPDLRELRLNGNKISSVPESIQSNIRLTLLDLGNNQLRAVSALETLRELTCLKNLNLRGNKLCDAGDYRQQISDVVPSVQILDSRKTAVQKSSQRREPQYSDKGKGKRQTQSGDKLPKKQQHGITSPHQDVPEGGCLVTHPGSAAVTAMNVSGGGKDKRKRKHLESDEDISSHPKKQKLSKKLAGRMKGITTSKNLQPALASDIKSKGGSEVVSYKERKKKGRKEMLAASVVEYRRKPHPVHTGEQASDFVISAAGGLTTTDGHSQVMIGKEVVRDTKTKRFKGHSGVVAVEEIRKKRRGKKRHALLVEVVDFESELGSGQTSSWT